MIFDEDLKELKRAPWPKCNEVADRLAALGAGAIPTLEAAALTARGHNARSAALRALAKVNRKVALRVAQKLADDKSFEVRQDAKEIIDSFG